MAPNNQEQKRSQFTIRWLLWITAGAALVAAVSRQAPHISEGLVFTGGVVAIWIGFSTKLRRANPAIAFLAMVFVLPLTVLAWLLAVVEAFAYLRQLP